MWKKTDVARPVKTKTVQQCSHEAGLCAEAGGDVGEWRVQAQLWF